MSLYVFPRLCIILAVSFPSHPHREALDPAAIAISSALLYLRVTEAS
jgi:hypothetical protein